jgi:PAS domain S-box-containing protein
MPLSLQAALFANSPEAILITDEHRIVREANAAACRLLGYSREEFIGANGADLIAGGATWFAEAAEHLGTDGHWRVELEMVAKDGGLVPVESWMVLVEESGERFVAGFLRDLSERKRLEQELRTTVMHYRTLVEQLPAAVYVLANDEQQTPLYFSSAIESLTGETPEEALAYHAHWYDLVHPEDRARVIAEDELTGENAEPFRAEYRHQRKDGSYVWVRDECVPIRDEEGKVVSWLGVMLDISERVQLQAARAENRAKSQFLGTVSHELRTPMQSVLGYAALLLGSDRGALTADQREDLTEIQRGADRAMFLIDQMLDLSQIEEGGLLLSIEPVDLASIVDAVRQEIAPRAAERGLALHVDLPAALPRVAADPARARQILRNLADNAVKFTEDGSIAITAAETGDRVNVVIRDTGIGIAPEALERIFEVFQQGDDSMARRFGGAGLGLALAQQLAALMGAGIRVQSLPDGGSTFTVHFQKHP